MNILALDDEPLALELLCSALAQVCPQATVYAFSDPQALLDCAAEQTCQIAFLDIQVRGMSGVELAKRLKEQTPELNIIFVTAYGAYAGAAMAMHASGYILKPVTAQKLLQELGDLRYPVNKRPNALLQCRCFGSFEVFDPQGVPLHFERTKAKEVLAYLVYRSGASCSIRELAAVLFEGGVYDARQRGSTQKAVSSMIHTLRMAGAGEVVVKKYNSVAINTARIDCDYYRFAQLDPAAVHAYHGEFMTQYAWAEFVLGYLEKIFQQA